MHALLTNAIVSIDPRSSAGVFIFDNHSEAPYSLSSGNEFILSGCNLQATLTGHDTEDFISGCASFCPQNVSDTYVEMALQRSGRNCYGMGCCQARISMSSNGLPMTLKYQTLNKNGDQELTSQPAYMLIAQEGWFDQRRFSKKMAGREESETANVQVPQVLQ
ncbi:uncharacterized protein [Triticum aestivum]|uniref:uncharacterized protein n=1 Tax=Triticum aestivum TaxID=4565 RepID=UPI001D00FBE5|nr:uncharacterized protein LOC123063684 [Triticum aestivum]